MSDERKYRQRGYHDDAPRERPARTQPSAPRPVDPAKGPKGRGLGAPTATAFRCAKCGDRQEIQQVEVTSHCAKCGADLHTCSNCVSFEPSIHLECRLGGATLADGRTAQRLAKKSTANDCTLFSPKTVAEFAREATRAVKEEPRSAFDALFKK
jgi:hypothetical protein